MFIPLIKQRRTTECKNLIRDESSAKLKSEKYEICKFKRLGQLCGEDEASNLELIGEFIKLGRLEVRTFLRHLSGLLVVNNFNYVISRLA